MRHLDYFFLYIFTSVSDAQKEMGKNYGIIISLKFASLLKLFISEGKYIMFHVSNGCPSKTKN